MLKYLVGIFFICHGIVFPIWGGVYWKLYTIEDLPYTTKVLWNRVDVGAVGIRIVGVLWLLSGLVWIIAGIGLVLLAPWWSAVTIAAALFSSIVCILGLPDGKWGLLINLAILALIYVNGRFAWV